MSQKNSLSEVRQQAHEEFFVLFCLFVFNFFFFFASCYYYYEIAGDSCLEMLNETTPKKILKDFHLLSAERLSLFLKYH